jgi:hypothetical protein
VLVSACDVPADGLAESVPLEIDLHTRLLHAVGLP